MAITTPLNPRLPVLIGVGQAEQRSVDAATLLEPLDLMEMAVRAALDDAGAASAADRIDRIVAVQGAWSYKDPARLVADRIRATSARSGLTGQGGDTPVTMLLRLAEDISAGQLGCAVLCGGEGIYSRRQLRKLGTEPQLTQQGDGVAPDDRYGTPLVMADDHDRRFGLEMPVRVYPLFEIALRHAERLSVEEHRAELGRLYGRFNEIAVSNPWSWSQTPLTADQIATPSATNRMISYPYPKVMNSNWFTDQAAAYVVASAAWAEAAGVPRDRWVFIHSGAKGRDTESLGERLDLHGSRSLRATGPRALELAGVGLGQLAHIDLYSCFPSAVRVAARELGIGADRDLTVTGGMSFFGGPMNNYSTHAVASIVPLLRRDAGEFGLVVANGGLLTKHAVAVLSTDPPDNGYRGVDCQADVDRFRPHAFTREPEGNIIVESYTVEHDTGAPARAIISGLTRTGARCWAVSTSPELMGELMANDACGWVGHVSSDGTFRI